jgi:hypothetical protein
MNVKESSDAMPLVARNKEGTPTMGLFSPTSHTPAYIKWTSDNNNASDARARLSIRAAHCLIRTSTADLHMHMLCRSGRKDPSLPSLGDETR